MLSCYLDVCLDFSVTTLNCCRLHIPRRSCTTSTRNPWTTSTAELSVTAHCTAAGKLVSMTNLSWTCQKNNTHIYQFVRSSYRLNMNRQERLRRPQELPDEADVGKLKDYTTTRISDMLADKYMLWDGHPFAELRDLAVSRLTLFNARRGGEPARLTLLQWKDAENWLNKARTPTFAAAIDCDHFHTMKVTFQGRKGNNHVVPVLFPLDTVQGISKLVEHPHLSVCAVFLLCVVLCTCNND